MSQNSAELYTISERTLANYNERAQDFWVGTRDHDVSQNINAFMKYIEGSPPYTILDFGCGPGRDLKTFHALGHNAIGLEGAAHFVEMAKAHSHCEVWQQDFLRLSLPSLYFDGIFANASLFHIPSAELARVLGELNRALKSRGVLFSSNPRGKNEEGWHRDRYAVHHDLENWRYFLTAAGFEELTHYYRPAGLPRVFQPWLASVWRKK